MFWHLVQTGQTEFVVPDGLPKGLKSLKIFKVKLRGRHARVLGDVFKPQRKLVLY